MMEARAALSELMKQPFINIPLAGGIGAAAGAACGAAIAAVIGTPMLLAAGVGAVAVSTFAVANRAIAFLAEKYNWSQRTVTLLNVVAMATIGSVALAGAVTLGILIPGSTAALFISLGLGATVLLYGASQPFQMLKTSHYSGPSDL